MKKYAKIAGAVVLAGASFSATAWWGGPYGYPYWGGYAPVVAAPVVTVSQEQLQAAAEAQRQAVEQLGTAGYAPWGSDPWGGQDPLAVDEDPMSDPFFQQAAAEREALIAVQRARREAFLARHAARRAMLKARYQALRDAYAPATEAQAPLIAAMPSPPAPVAEAPAAPAPAAEAPAEQPVVEAAPSAPEVAPAQ